MTWAAKAVSFALADWTAGVSESKRQSLDEIFRMSGWSPKAPAPPARVPDWCGLAVCKWLLQAGMHPAHRRSFYHTKNVEAFFTYGAKNNVNPKRLITKGRVGAVWYNLKDYHESKQALRLWVSGHAVSGFRDFQPGDVVLINHRGARDVAHHITLVLKYDPATSILITIEGNATGVTSSGRIGLDSVVQITRDLKLPVAVSKIYGVGRLSPLDIEPTPFDELATHAP